MDSSNVSAPHVNGYLGELRWLGLSRPELMALLLIVGAANALLPSIINGIVVDGPLYAVLNTFEISAVVWIALFVAVKCALLSEPTQITPSDRFALITLMVLCLLPIGPAMWLLLAGLAFKFILETRPGSMLHRSGWLCLALTVPMFWSKRLFNVFSSFFLAIDAELVSSITGTQRISNLVAVPNGSGFLQIAAPCSSMANVSLAVLCWVLFTQVVGMRWKPYNILWCAIACLTVVAINVVRISLIGFYPSKYELLHGPVGATVTSWLTIVAVFSICLYGVGRGRFKFI